MSAALQDGKQPGQVQAWRHRFVVEFTSSRQIQATEIGLPADARVIGEAEIATIRVAPASELASERLVLALWSDHPDDGGEQSCVTVYASGVSMDDVSAVHCQVAPVGYLDADQIEGLVALEVFAEVPAMDKHDAGAFGTKDDARVALANFGLALGGDGFRHDVYDTRDDTSERAWVLVAVEPQRAAELLAMARSRPYEPD